MLDSFCWGWMWIEELDQKVNVRAPVDDIGPSSMGNIGSNAKSHVIAPYTKVYVRRNKKQKSEVSEACGLDGFSN